MKYNKFSFENFKGIKKLDVDLTGDVTTLIGLNESGKTTILEAIFCFSYGAERLDVINPGLESLRDPEQWVPIALRANFSDSIKISAVVELDDDDRKKFVDFMRREHKLRVVDPPAILGISESYRFEGSRLVAGKGKKTWDLKLRGTTGQQRTPRDYGSTTEEWQAAVTYLKGQLPKIWYFPNFLFELPDKFMLNDGVGSRPEDLDRAQFYRATFERILGALGMGVDLDSHVVARLASDDKTDERNLRALMLELGRVVTGTILEGWNRIFGSAPVGQEVHIDADTDVQGNPYLELRIKGQDGYYDLSERSLGFRWFFMFLLMTSYQGVRSSEGSRALFLLDEPASNLHSSAQAELLKSFESLSEDCHLVYTTHSHHLINVKWLDSAYVVKNEALGTLSFEDYITTRLGARTSVTATPYRRFVSEHPTETSYFQPVLDLLEYRPSSVEPVPDVVLVEGKSDFYLLRYCIDVLGMESDLRLVPGGGAGALDSLIRLHIGWGRSFVVLLDGDAEGIKQRDRYLTDLGPVLKSRCMLLPEASGTIEVKEIEDLLTESDRRGLIDAVHGSDARVTKKALHQAVLELYGRNEVYDLTADARRGIEDLLGVLTRALAQQAVINP